LPHLVPGQRHFHLAVYDKNILTRGLNFDNIMETFPQYKNNFPEASPNQTK
jgi:hypothetical protein